MKKVLFLPLNTNHVLIFDSIIERLSCESVVLCHDRISNARRYQTENLLREKHIPYIHFPREIKRDLSDNFIFSILNFFKMRQAIDDVLKEIMPSALILAIDNDPIAQICIRLCKRYKIKTFLIQEGLIRPYEYTTRKTYPSDLLYRFLSYFGIYLKYNKYGTSGCDKILASGTNAAQIFKSRGVNEKQIEITGQPKYDNYLERVKSYDAYDSNSKKFLFAAGSSLVRDNSNIQFLKSLVESVKKCDSSLIVKMHPRTPQTPQDIYEIIGEQDISCIQIVKQSDDTFDLLKDIYALITVSSTMIIEALLLDKEGISVDYLAGEQRLHYSEYDAIHTIEGPEQLPDVIKAVLHKKKAYANKKRLLEDELFKLDGKASERVARILQSSS